MITVQREMYLQTTKKQNPSADRVSFPWLVASRTRVLNADP